MLVYDICHSLHVKIMSLFEFIQMSSAGFVRFASILTKW